MNKEKIEALIDVYLTAYIAALNKTKNPDLSIQAALMITTIVNNSGELEKKPKTENIIFNPLYAFMDDTEF